jgi:hypothetical protein
MRSFMLKVAATGLTLLASAASAVYVNGHVKSSAAPLHPAVASASASASAGPLGPGGRLSLSPSVTAADVQAVTSTHAS